MASESPVCAMGFDYRQVLDIETLIASFSEYGVEAFTFSSGWSSATGSAWAFLQNGCTLAGMAEINGPHKAFGSDEYEKRPAFLFRVQ